MNKIPKLRPTYAMLLGHPWLAPLLKPPVIAEEDEEEADDAGQDRALDVVDAEIAEWVTNAMEAKRKGSMGKKAQPALHAAPFQGVSGTDP